MLVIKNKKLLSSRIDSIINLESVFKFELALPITARNDAE